MKHGIGVVMIGGYVYLKCRAKDESKYFTSDGLSVSLLKKITLDAKVLCSAWRTSDAIVHRPIDASKRR